MKQCFISMKQCFISISISMNMNMFREARNTNLSGGNMTAILMSLVLSQCCTEHHHHSVPVPIPEVRVVPVPVIEYRIQVPIEREYIFRPRFFMRRKIVIRGL